MCMYGSNSIELTSYRRAWHKSMATHRKDLDEKDEKQKESYLRIVQIFSRVFFLSVFLNF